MYNESLPAGGCRILGRGAIGEISTLSQIDIAQQLVEESQLRQPTMANLTDATALAEAGRSQYSCQPSVTNLGRIDLVQQYGNIRIEHFMHLSLCQM
ncbi:hypothetical protein H6F95_01970 [Cyanobacteria bacterium FACHB-471]|nr:hypothetical protein [Cyanobacteria bacterium FACHB-471]